MSVHPETYRFSCFRASANIDETEDRTSGQTEIELEAWRQIFGGGEDGGVIKENQDVSSLIPTGLS